MYNNLKRIRISAIHEVHSGMQTISLEICIVHFSRFKINSLSHHLEVFPDTFMYFVDDLYRFYGNDVSLLHYYEYFAFVVNGIRDLFPNCNIIERILRYFSACLPCGCHIQSIYFLVFLGTLVLYWFLVHMLLLFFVLSLFSLLFYLSSGC